MRVEHSNRDDGASRYCSDVFIPSFDYDLHPDDARANDNTPDITNSNGYSNANNKPTDVTNSNNPSAANNTPPVALHHLRGVKG